MRSYRFYSLDRLGRAVERREEQCRDDPDALSVANGMNGTRDIEVWFGSRQVARIAKRTGSAECASESSNDDAAPSPALEKIRHAEAHVVNPRTSIDSGVNAEELESQPLGHALR